MGPAQAAGCDDRQLLALIREGDLRAFEELYRCYHLRLSRFLINLLHRPQLVEEVLNDTMMVVWNKPASFRGDSRLSTWIFAIAYRKALKALRRQDEPVEDIEAFALACDDEGPDEQVRRHQVQRLLLDAIGELSADHRTVVDLTYFHEMGYREIAEIMDCPVDTVKTRMFHARRHLRRILTSELGDWI